ncbi:GNAT family acetyltransferase [Oceanicola sp. 22II-s10i]|uniref:GNAT family N-acetyltransferase n=1 Tax=Oceanicola sp. 22II-s10i TaxID=1317116 RepID=UPI000B51FFCE|nr:GNAT family N-acetyltransferase [Oceanicola sp. 22II-s10i]OWU85171.1 GNAT family acetyltransferase [Oceanicola sp. 22II-s10i]
MSGFSIRPVVAADHPQILAFWNPIFRDTLVTFASVEKTPETLADYVDGRVAKGRAFLVAVDGDTVLGFATYDQFRGGDGYVHAMEHTVILAEAARGRGVGRALMTAIEDHARAAGAHTMVAGISGANPAAVAFHAAIGYAACGRMPQSGRKFGQWIDLILMQKLL